MNAVWNGVALFTFIACGFGSALINEAQAESPKDSQPIEFIEAASHK